MQSGTRGCATEHVPPLCVWGPSGTRKQHRITAGGFSVGRGVHMSMMSRSAGLELVRRSEQQGACREGPRSGHSRYSRPVIERTMLDHMGNRPHCDNGEAVGLRATPLPSARPAQEHQSRQHTRPNTDHITARGSAVWSVACPRRASSQPGHARGWTADPPDRCHLARAPGSESRIQPV